MGLFSSNLTNVISNDDWGCGAAGSASAWHAEGQGFKSPQLHSKRPADETAGLFLLLSSLPLQHYIYVQEDILITNSHDD